MPGDAILFVDDERDILDLAVAALREAGYTVQPASNGDIALVLLEQGLQFRLLVTDVVMPGVFDGFALARRARELLPGLPVVYTTGFSRVASIRSPGAPHGATLPKPWRPSELLRLVKSLLPPPAVPEKNPPPL
jgi:two-component system, cell cycle sensor histidine kinase and response regulator CckA